MGELTSDMSSRLTMASPSPWSAQVMTGSYSFPLPDGTIATFDWVADAAGFRIVNESPLHPVAPVDPHPIPAHAQEQIDFAEAQRAAGPAWDEAAGAWL